MSLNIVSQDEYETVINSELTYLGLANILLASGQVVFAWTDEQGTQLDILISYKPVQFGYLQRGMNTTNSLFIAVSLHGMFGFALNKTEKFPDYVGEKLGLGGQNATTAELAGLINGICERLEA